MWTDVAAHLCPQGTLSRCVLTLTFPPFSLVPDFIMWATCCNWFCLDGQPEEAPPPQGARTQAYSNPGYSSFPSPTGSEPNCKACGAHFASMARKVSVDLSACSAAVASGPQAGLLTLPWCLCKAGNPELSFHKSIKTNQAEATRLGIDLEPARSEF